MSANVLVVEDDRALRDALTASLRVSGYQTTSVDCAESALSLLNQGNLPDMVVTDVQMGAMSGIDLLKNIRRQHASLPIILMTAYSQVKDAVEVMRMGACDYLQKPFDSDRLTSLIESYLPKKQDSKIIIEDPKSKQLYDYARRVAATDSNVLLFGPSGAGKEVMAKFIHGHSPRADQPLVAINCAAIPENMLESTLFGYEKGAFTGALQACAGKFEQAQGGTLLLDEISEMDLALQAKILRVIQEKEVERLAGKKLIKLDVRIIATTNRELKNEVAEKRFREDLYYRLCVFPLHCLALKDRPMDIIPLVEARLAANEYVAARGGLALSGEAKAKLLTYSWPGNVRELDNLVQRLALMAQERLILADDIQFEQDAGSVAGVLHDSVTVSQSQLGNDLANHEFQLIVDALARFKGKKKDVADGLGISPRTLRYKLARMRELGYSIPGKGDL